ncbi:MAG: DoxX family membrane protein [Planctomycetaceae bacterium]|nr:DoxX family membrane protein [Planctomycetaceae bacterium]
MTDTKKCCCVSIALIVLLRLSIGWQFLYEGLWKFNTVNTPTPWSAEGYLKNAQGPLRDTFRNMTGDPDDLQWLDRDAVAVTWDDWAVRFETHYGLDESQKKKLSELLNGVADFRVELAELPEGVSPKDLGKNVKFDAKAKRLICDGKLRMLKAEREKLLGLLKGEPNVDIKRETLFADAVNRLYELATRPQGISAKEKLGALLVGNPEVAGRVFKEHEGTIDYKRIGDIDLYKSELARYETNLAKAKQQSAMQFPRDHLQKQWSDLQKLKGKVVGPVKSLDSELKVAAKKLLTFEQLAGGPVRLPSTPVDRINQQTMWGLTILGVLLLIGLGTRYAALGGAVMLTMFYLAMPPWPGVPEAPGPEHSFIVNKNFIEVMALLAIAALPTGQWFGLDRLCSKLCCRKKCCGGATCATTSTTSG